jgi:membrane dipeptidase
MAYRLPPLLCVLFFVGCVSSKPALRVSERASRVHRRAFVLDTHCDTLLRIADEGLDLGRRASDGHVDLVRLREGGVKAQVFAVFVSPRYLPGGARRRALELIDALRAELARHADRIALVGSVEEARRAAARGKIAAFIGLEGGYALQDDPAALKLFFERGVRYMTLTWRLNTNWADGGEDRARFGGLTPLGGRIVREMNRLGMVVDVSHASDRTFWDVLATTSRPVIASHSNTRALCDHPRNLSDAMLRALAANGGVIGITYVAAFLDPAFLRRYEALKRLHAARWRQVRRVCDRWPRRCRDRYRALMARVAPRLPRVSLERVIDHIDHAVRVAGIDHVGLGSDFDGYSTGPEELPDAAALPLITERLLARGYSERDVAKILGGNFLRVFREAIGR